MQASDKKVHRKFRTGLAMEGCHGGSTDHSTHQRASAETGNDMVQGQPRNRNSPAKTVEGDELLEEAKEGRVPKGSPQSSEGDD